MTLIFPSFLESKEGEEVRGGLGEGAERGGRETTRHKQLPQDRVRPTTCSTHLSCPHGLESQLN